MPQNADAIIIGAGVIGAATAFEMAKAGYRTVSLDKNPASGYGSTSGSCAIIRVHYSTNAGWRTFARSVAWSCAPGTTAF